MISYFVCLQNVTLSYTDVFSLYLWSANLLLLTHAGKMVYFTHLTMIFLYQRSKNVYMNNINTEEIVVE